MRRAIQDGGTVGCSLAIAINRLFSFYLESSTHRNGRRTHLGLFIPPIGEAGLSGLPWGRRHYGGPAYSSMGGAMMALFFFF
jgi:hypothetical protein